MAIRVTLDTAPPPQPSLPIAIVGRAVMGAFLGLVALFALACLIVIPWWLIGLAIPALDYDAALARWGHDRDSSFAALPWVWAAAAGVVIGLYHLSLQRRWRASHSQRTMRDMTRAVARAAGRDSRRVRRSRWLFAAALLWIPAILLSKPVWGEWLGMGADGRLPDPWIGIMVAITCLGPVPLAALAAFADARATPARRQAVSAVARVAMAYGPFLLFAALLAAVIAGGAAVGGGDAAGRLSWQADYGPPLVLGGIVLLYWLSIRTSGALERRYASRLAAWALPRVDEERRGDRRAPVVYLRSFGDDFALVVASEEGERRRVTRLETLLADDARRFGPVIAIGEPGYLPVEGAARAYFADDAWQNAVRCWIDEAAFVLVVAGYTSGVSWELETVIARGHAAKLIVVFPPDPDHFSARWAWLRERAHASRIARLPARPVEGTMLACLDRYGEILLLTAAEPDVRRYRSALVIALAEIFAV